MFDALLPTPWRQTYAIFFSQQNHRARREMLEALIIEREKHALTERKNTERFKKMKRILGRVKRAAKKRNDIAHGLWFGDAAQEGMEIWRHAIKKTYESGIEYSKTDLAKARDQIKALSIDLYYLAYPQWRRKNWRHL
tara:strand:- start:35 stop:448 length:414 start_codon:yes stop_codon:yes gene_type:complete